MSSSYPNQPPTNPATASGTRTRTWNISTNTLLGSVLTLAIAILIASTFGEGNIANLFGFKRLLSRSLASGSGITTVAISSSLFSSAPTSGKPASGLRFESTMRTPVYFLSHGGPNVMYEHEHPAYSKLGQIGREITSKVKPSAVVVFSAHWQGGKDTVLVNTAEITDLIYDFYGFPDYYYKEKYPNVGNKEVANKVLHALKEANIKAEGVKRGLDHGVWASFKCAFEPDTNPLNVPIVQVSLFNTEDPIQHYRLGQAISKLRDENILIIVSGMAVHNLRDMWFTMGDSKPLPYTASFDEALKDAVTAAPEEREKKMVDLMKRQDARQAHPYFDHLLPIYIGAGAAGSDLGKRLWTFKEGSMSWAQFRFGEVGNSSGPVL
ncbi:hypothetical protein MAP00_006703 [Monascus purpureus]|nr:hypothetical protein MAP00_006703 [Monascus purpureus]